ncbi:stalk domain-containing protein [Paenibacillus silviterrae]|uniref:stalk domain-containing protein n=1 Tax=Paenibacillus silviterrae TaxID=3242194 RepID=UPI002542F08C|nr:stalk domain-containing protein [Paenibacillus chinjuensis]
MNVYLNGERIHFTDVQPVIKDGRTLVPFRKLFETLGFSVQWSDTGSLRQAIGVKEGLEIRLTIDHNEAAVNGSTVPLDVPAQIIDSSTMVPLRFVSENSGYQVTFSTTGSEATVQIRTAVSTTQVEPYVVKGRVVDAKGKPVEGADIFADNQLLYNSNLLTVTDANGYYRIELPLLATTWNMGGSHTIEGYVVDLTPEIDKPFAGNTGAIRNFTIESETVKGELYLYMDLNSFIEGYSENQVELTLTPVGPLAGGSSGKVITGHGYNFPGGFGMKDVPVGTYKVTAKHTSTDGASKQLLVRKRNKGQFAESAEIEFSPLVEGIYQTEVEVKAPK